MAIEQGPQGREKEGFILLACSGADRLQPLDLRRCNIRFECLINDFDVLSCYAYSKDIILDAKRRINMIVGILGSA